MRCLRFWLRKPRPPSSYKRHQNSNLESLRNLTLVFYGFATPAVFDYISCPKISSLRFRAGRGYCKKVWISDATTYFLNQTMNISHLSFIRVILSNFTFLLLLIVQGCSASLEVRICWNSPFFGLLSINQHGYTVEDEYLIALKRFFNNAPLISDLEGTLRRCGVLNEVTIYAFSSFMFTHQQLAELRDHATEGEDMPVRVVISVSDRIETFSW